MGWEVKWTLLLQGGLLIHIEAQPKVWPRRNPRNNSSGPGQDVRSSWYYPSRPSPGRAKNNILFKYY